MLIFVLGIDQALSGNYTCLAKNLYGSDSVVYAVKVLPLPDPPSIRATPYKDYIVVEWDEIKTYTNDTTNYGISKCFFSYNPFSCCVRNVTSLDPYQ
jgi:hypothetical protein